MKGSRNLNPQSGKLSSLAPEESRVVTRRPKTPLPTASEFRILHALWELGQATVEDIVTSFPPRERPNYKTVQTFLRIMEQKNFVTHSVQGRVFVFQPIVGRDEVNQCSVRQLLQQNFGGSASGLLVNLLSLDSVDQSDLDQLERMIREHKSRNASAGRKGKVAK
jgi:BlaI family penicillinase repressor